MDRIWFKESFITSADYWYLINLLFSHWNHHLRQNSYREWLKFWSTAAPFAWKIMALLLLVMTCLLNWPFSPSSLFIQINILWTFTYRIQIILVFHWDALFHVLQWLFSFQFLHIFGSSCYFVIYCFGSSFYLLIIVSRVSRAGYRFRGGLTLP